MTEPRLLTSAGREAYAYPLLIRQLLLNLGRETTEIVSAGRRFTYPTFIERIHRLASLLSTTGVQAGDTVAVMDWDSHRYLESYFAVPMMGAVLQTVNVRLTRDVIGFTLRQTKAKVVLCHSDFSPIIEELRATLPDLRHVLRLSDEQEAGTYEALIDAASPEFPFVDFDENAIATTFHTTGTTGDPKQVFFSHRQLVLHTLAVSATLANQPAGQGLHRSDVYMPLTPMFHVHAWGLPYVATLLGMKQVYPGRYDPHRILELKKSEGVTFSHGVPTLLRMILNAAEGASESLAPWAMLVGGSALSVDLADAAARKGIVALGGYGMSETGPILTIARTGPDDATGLRARAGIPIPLVQTRIDRDRGGELLVRAPWLTQGYAGQAESDELWAGGWLHTQDIVERDPDGGIRIVDRTKDVIKTGGEWISSIEIEALLVGHPVIAEAAVVGIASEQWGERPVAFVVTAQGAPAPPADEVQAFVASHATEGRISRYAVPDRIIFQPELPRTSVGKIDKKRLRRDATESDVAPSDGG
ncbi:long-chain-fatty-acid--CoA ligase [Xanthomonas hortorum]|uniref:Long-chain-fatty-acid--CoA ligase n=1 Tax=Xanthomonas hortorum pv. hederae TaxID=453603 RepID=A0A9X4BPW0_9XANT|nr:long-chain-fatty-acid--CoA ligase [Xanthomonas hortorum]MCE4369626.1 long-chain-fatty-acid--CoA ligase [Xanthomonas hortorum pv. hederae]MDC8637124.1 long-chain-fatty-acid--CoA ligase [Xanthomonas hortorum pv. hederae]PPU86170.1 long-chain fatty acid--CoA ligase [Xanthomonas hortorum pv. hederae]PUF01234.1 long-chain fatty acid--CoA ligase [Xanthomonas hortorum pv. hederae]